MDIPWQALHYVHDGVDPGQLLRINHRVAPREPAQNVNVDTIVTRLIDAVDDNRLPIWPDRTLFTLPQQTELIELATATWGNDDVDVIVGANDQIASRVRELLNI
jgi:hypothetical protein